MSWHIDDRTLAAYAAGGTTAVAAASTEAHLTTCADCRGRLVPRVDAGRLDAIWREVDDRVERSALPWFERVLVRVGVSEDSARLLAATPSLRVSWLASLVVAVAFAVAAAGSSPRGLAVYLAIAPMLPVAGVAAAYGRHADPAYELAVAAPYSLLRLLLLRTIAVVGSTLVVTAAGSLLLLGHGWEAVAWLLPALALSTTTLALSARLAPVWAAAWVLGTWLAVVGVSSRQTHDDLAAFGVVGQLAALALTAAAAVAILRLRPAYAFDSRRSA
jgi:hypothetical protein